MSRSKKNGRVINCIIRQPEYDAMVKFSDLVGLSHTSLVEKALRQYIESYNFTDKNGVIIPKMKLEDFVKFDFSNRI